MKALLPLLTWSALCSPVLSIYFFLDGNHPKCFYEELTRGTLVVGDYTAEEFDSQTHTWTKHDGLTNYISVDEVFDNDHRVVSQKGPSSGRFTFSSADSGEHRICFTLSSSSSKPGWLSESNPNGGIKLSLDLAIGHTSSLEHAEKGKILNIAQRAKELKGRLQDIRREQIWQREREAEFRDQSETTNARVVRWTLIQLLVLGVTCTWQLSHLRNFFIKQKLT